MRFYEPQELVVVQAIRSAGETRIPFDRMPAMPVRIQWVHTIPPVSVKHGTKTISEPMHLAALTQLIPTLQVLLVPVCDRRYGPWAIVQCPHVHPLRPTADGRNFSCKDAAVINAECLKDGALKYCMRPEKRGLSHMKGRQRCGGRVWARRTSLQVTVSKQRITPSGRYSGGHTGCGLPSLCESHPAFDSPRLF